MTADWTSGTPDAPSKLAWVARRLWWLLPLLFAGLLWLGASVAPPDDQPRFAARALVVGSDLEFHADQLPRLAHAVFDSPEVRQIAAEGGADPSVAPDSELQVLEGTVGMWVLSRADDPEPAAVTANALANALAARLTATEVGAFTVQSQATPPDEPSGWLGWPAVLLVALFGSAALFAGVVGAVLVLRRPVVSGAEAATSAGVPYIGTVRLAGRGTPPDPRHAIGLRALLERLFPGGAGQVAFVSGRQSEDARQALSVVAAQALARRGRVGLAASALPVRMRPRWPERIVPLAATHVRTVEEMPAVVDCGLEDDEDLPELLPMTIPTVLVVRQGTSATKLRAALGRFASGSLRGLVLVERRRLRRGSPRVAGGEEALQTIPREQRAPSRG